MRIYTTAYGKKVWRCRNRGASRPFCAHSTCYPDETDETIEPGSFVLADRWIQREFISDPMAEFVQSVFMEAVLDAEFAPSGFVDSFSIVNPIEVSINLDPPKSKPGRRVGFLEDE